MQFTDYYKNQGIKFAVLTLLVMLSPKFLNQYIIKYISFLGTFSNYVASFIVIFILLILGNFILNKTLNVT
jgi:hypothetical protein